MPEFTPGDVFVDHRIEGLAGRGGMGVVYRATQLGLERTVALKVITPALAQEEDFRRRFVAESKAAASIEHPNVIPVYYAGEREGVLFIVMRYIDGPDLRALVRVGGQLDPERAAHVVAQVGAALDAAHGHGLVHRDVKPANVLLGQDDHAYLTDFGLTKRTATTADGAVSRAGGWVGTLGYVAPEQIRGERVDARTDVYALGCVLVHALTGSAPYVRDSDEATLWAHLNAPPPTDALAPEFAPVVERALSKDPADRYPSAGDFGRAALAAAGRSAAPGPERNVARGAAAPEGTPYTAATVRASPQAHEGETHVSPPERGETAVTARAGGAGRSGRRPLAIAAAALLAAGVLVAVLIGGGEDSGDPAARTTATTTTPPSGDSKVGRLRPIATRPNAITISRGRVWVMSGEDGQVLLLDSQRGALKRRIQIRSGGTALAAGFGSVWALKGQTRSLLRFDTRTKARIGAPTTIAVDGLPVVVATGQGSVWVGVRKKGRRDGSGESLVKIDPDLSPLGQEPIVIPGGVQDVAVGENAVWVTTFGEDVIRIDPQNLKKTRSIRVGRGLNGIAVGEGAVWVANGAGKALTRINPKTLNRRSVPLGVVPTRVAVGGGSVWVTARDANRLFRVDPEKIDVRERLDTGPEPFAIDVTGGHSLWLTLVDKGSGGGVQRVGFYP